MRSVAQSRVQSAPSLLLPSTDRRVALRPRYRVVVYAQHRRRYFTSVYWAFTTITTVGYGDIHAYNMWEMAVSILSMVIGVGVFNSVASTLNAELAAKTAAKMDGEKKMNTIAAFLALRHVPEGLAIEIREFYQRKFTHEIAEFDVSKLLAELPSVLATQLEEYVDATTHTAQPHAPLPGKHCQPRPTSTGPFMASDRIKFVDSSRLHRCTTSRLVAAMACGRSLSSSFSSFWVAARGWHCCCHL